LLHVSDKHRSSFYVENTIAASFDLLLESARVNDGRLPTDASNGLGTTTALAITVKRYASVLGVDGAVVSKQKVASDKGTLALHALERPFFRVRSFMSAAVLASAESSVEELALVFPLWHE